MAIRIPLTTLNATTINFVNILEAIPFSAEKASQRELKRYLPDVQTAFHVMNWRVTYPVTIQDVDLKTAFLSLNGVQDLIARIVDGIYKSAEVDEFFTVQVHADKGCKPRPQLEYKDLFKQEV